MAEVQRSAATSLSQAYITHKIDAKADDLRAQFLAPSHGGLDVEAQDPPAYGDVFEDEHGNVETKNSAGRTMWTSVVVMLAAGTLATNVLIMATFGGTISMVAGVFASLVAISVAVAELKLEDMESEYLSV
jgi:hypothetical protein